MRRHEVTALNAITRLREDNSARWTRTSEQALVSAPERDKRWDKFTILCDSQKHTTCLEINRPKYNVSPLLFTWNIMATTRGQGFKQFRFRHDPLTKRFGSIATGIPVIVLSIFPQ